MDVAELLDDVELYVIFSVPGCATFLVSFPSKKEKRTRIVFGNDDDDDLCILIHKMGMSD